MSNGNQVPNATFTAGNTIAASTFVTLSGNFTVSQSITGDAPIGISQAFGNSYYEVGSSAPPAATVGQPVSVYTSGEEAWLLITSTVTVSSQPYLEVANGGGGQPATSTDFIAAVALQNGVAGDLIRVLVGAPKNIN